MSDFFKRVLGIVHVEESADEITLRGVKVDPLARDIMSVWSTSRIEANMFTRFKSSVISFPNFFAPDFHYMLRAIRANHRYRRTGDGAIRQALLELENNTWMKRIQEEHSSIFDRSKLNLFKLTPLPHQEEFFQIYDERTQKYGLTGYLLSAAAGSGKTLTCLMTAEMLRADLVVMVVPKNSVHKVWSRHLSEEYKKPQPHWIASDNKPYNRERFIITHYEALEKTLEVVRRAGGSNVVVVLDESHNMNEAESLRTQLFIQLCKMTGSKHVLWSSGTPIKALGYESIPLLRTIDPLFTPDVEQRFRKIYGRDAKRALDILRNRMGMISYRVEKKDVVDNKASHSIIKIQLKNGHAYTLDTVRKEMQDFIGKRLKYYQDNFREYEGIFNAALKAHEETLETKEQKVAFKVYRDYIATIRKGYDPKTMSTETKYCNNYELKVLIPSIPQAMRSEFKNARSVIKYADLKVLGEALGGILGRKRVQCHLDMVESLELKPVIDKADKKTVIFTSYVEAVVAMGEKLKSQKFQPVLVYGETNKNLTQLVTQFEKVPDVNPMVATFQSMSTAVPLIVANTAVFLNVPFRDHELTQAKARIDRLGQDMPVHFISVELDTGRDPNVSTRSRDIMEWSREQVAQIMGKSYSGDVVAAAELAGTAAGMEEFTDSGSVALEYYSEQASYSLALEEEVLS